MPTVDLPFLPSWPVKAIPVLLTDYYRDMNARGADMDSHHDTLQLLTLVVPLAASALHSEVLVSLGLGNQGGGVLGCETLEEFHGGCAKVGRRAGRGGHLREGSDQQVRAGDDLSEFRRPTGGVDTAAASCGDKS